MTQVFSVPEISCQHCKKAIELELKKQESVKKVNVNVSAKTVTVSGKLDSPEIIKILDSIGYEASLISKK